MIDNGSEWFGGVVATDARFNFSGVIKRVVIPIVRKRRYICQMIGFLRKGWTRVRWQLTVDEEARPSNLLGYCRRNGADNNAGGVIV